MKGQRTFHGSLVFYSSSSSFLPLKFSFAKMKKSKDGMKNIFSMFVVWFFRLVIRKMCEIDLRFLPFVEPGARVWDDRIWISE